MIITLKGCTATAFIGGLNFFKVSKGTVSGADVTIRTSTINKDEATSTSARELATVALKSNYENLVVTVTMGGATVNWFANGKVTIPANTTVTGDIKISASATAISGGGDSITVLYPLAIDSTSHSNFTPSKVPVILFTEGYPLLKTNNFNYIRFISTSAGKCEFYKYSDVQTGASLSNISKTLIGEMNVTAGYNTCEFETTKLNENETLGVLLTKTSGDYPMVYIQEMEAIPEVEQRVFAYSSTATGVVAQVPSSTSGSNLEIGFNPNI